jgi:hypothetical protein
MRKSVFVLLAGLAIVLGTLAQANASTLPYIGHAKSNLNMTPIENAACRGWGRWCGPGHHRVCRHGSCWCAPCW